MNMEDVYDFLKKNNIKFEVDEHILVFNMNALKRISLKYPNYDAKNIFLRDDKKENYYLATVWLIVNDLVSVIKNNGNEVHLTKI